MPAASVPSGRYPEPKPSTAQGSREARRPAEGGSCGRLPRRSQAFGDFGDDHGFLNRPQGAYVGPQLKWEGQPKGLPFEIEVDAGWLAAVGSDRREAPSQARINLELERRF